MSSDGKITATDPTSGSAYGLNFNAVGSAGSNGSSGGSGGESGFLTVNNTGAITITAGQADPVVGALFVDAGGNGGDATGNKGFGGNGGDAYGNITAVNSGSIFLTSNGGRFAAGATGLGLLAAGGNGGSGYTLRNPLIFSTQI
jgi:hypothetical protein